MKKQLVSATKTYQPSYPDELLVDDKPNVGSFNLITSDGVARAIAGASGEVPQVTEDDNGKVLKAVYDAGGPAVEWGEATVDQVYDATSTNAQSGVAVASAIAAIPSEVTTASGHFDLGGDVPVKVNYTGAPHVVSDYITLTNPTSTTVGTSLGIVFSTQGNKNLGTDTANLVISDTIHANFSGIFYASNPPSPGPEITTSTGHITSGTINPQTIVLSGSNPAESFGFGNDVIMVFGNLTDGETAESIMTKVSIQHWPAQTVDGYETTIPVIPSVTGNAGKVLTVNSGATGTEWTNFTQIEVVSSMPASPTSGVLYIVTGA